MSTTNRIVFLISHFSHLCRAEQTTEMTLVGRGVETDACIQPKPPSVREKDLEDLEGQLGSHQRLSPPETPSLPSPSTSSQTRKTRRKTDAKPEAKIQKLKNNPEEPSAKHRNFSVQNTDNNNEALTGSQLYYDSLSHNSDTKNTLDQEGLSPKNDLFRQISSKVENVLLDEDQTCLSTAENKTVTLEFSDSDGTLYASVESKDSSARNASCQENMSLMDTSEAEMGIASKKHCNLISGSTKHENRSEPEAVPDLMTTISTDSKEDNLKIEPEDVNHLKNIACEVCSYRTAKKRNLEAHMRVHTGMYDCMTYVMSCHVMSCMSTCMYAGADLGFWKDGGVGCGW